MVVASIDLMGGKVVQLRQGSEKMLERDDPFVLAKDFDRYGEIAVIDLDAAMGRGSNMALLKQLVKHGECRVGGGVRSVEYAQELAAAGAVKVIIGSKAFENEQINHSFLQALTAQLGRDRVIIAIDAWEGFITTHGWKQRTNIPVLQAAKDLEPYASEFLFTCVEREGTLTGIDLTLVKALKKATKSEITVAGGVSTLDELRAIAALGMDVQLGMALYTGKINLTDAFIASLNWAKMELIPTIAQDESGAVLMLAYSNADSVRKAFECGKMTYYSRSRNELWTKGESSGHVQQLLRMRADCDQDAILATVKQIGVACHTGAYTCFGDRRQL